jgi:outer membrane protein assembly factor BamB
MAIPINKTLRISAACIIVAVMFSCKKSGPAHVTGADSANITGTDSVNITKPDSAATLYMSGNNTLYCINAQTGVQKWAHPFVASTNFSSPIYSKGYVYIGASDGTLNAFDSLGSLKWSTFTGDSITVSSPVVSNGLVFANNSLYLFAFDAISGMIKWKFPAGSIYEDGVTFGESVYNNMVYFSPYTLYALDQQTGTLVWSKDVENASLPKVINNRLYTFDGTDNHILALNAGNGNEIWDQYSEGFQLLSVNVAYGNAYFYTDHGLSVVDTATGITKWSLSYLSYPAFPWDFQSGSSPVVADSIVHLVTNAANEYNAITGVSIYQYGINTFGGDVTVVDGHSYFGSVNEYYYNGHYGSICSYNPPANGYLWMNNALEENYQSTPCVVTKSGKVYRAGDIY